MVLYTSKKDASLSVFVDRHHLLVEGDVEVSYSVVSSLLAYFNTFLVDMRKIQNHSELILGAKRLYTDRK